MASPWSASSTAPAATDARRASDHPQPQETIHVAYRSDRYQPNLRAEARRAASRAADLGLPDLQDLGAGRFQRRGDQDVWEATPGETHSIKGTTFEFCHLLAGHVEIEEKDGPTYTFRTGDSFVMKPGFVGIWRTIETVRKIYVCVYA
jgi:uncharacterized cupin superfamily protein